jgi:hypothetical protein
MAVKKRVRYRSGISLSILSEVEGPVLLCHELSRMEFIEGVEGPAPLETQCLIGIHLSASG